MTDVYAKLGVKRRINAAGTLTRLGGSPMAPEVLDAMRREALSGAEVKGVVDLWLGCADRGQQQGHRGEPG